MALDIKIRGIRSPIPAGYVLGRLPGGAGAGDVELIDIATLTSHITAVGNSGGAAPTVLPSIASGHLLANSTASTAVAADTTLTALIDRAIGSTQGDLLYRNSSAWTVLAPGTTGQILETLGAAANPAWAGISTILDTLGSAQGDILYRGASGWSVLTPGTSGKFLKTQGASADPIWDTAGGTGANPTATASDVAVNGSATTFMRSDAAPAVQKGSSSAFGLVKVDNTTITAASGVISAVSGAAGINQLTGDVTAGPGTGSQAATLANSGVTAASYTAANITVDAKGRITSAADGSGFTGAGNGLYAAIMSAVPTASNTGLSTWLNQNTATVSDTATGITIVAPSQTARINGRTKAAPGSTPYKVTALIAVTNLQEQFSAGGIGWYDGTNKLHIMMMEGQTTGYNVQVQRWSTPTAFSSQDFNGNAHYDGLLWFRLEDDGTNVSFEYSMDGATFRTVYTVAKSSGYLGSTGYSNIVLFTAPNSAAINTTLMSYKEA